MDGKVEKLKSLIKSKAKERPSFGTDPNDPWSTKSNISEDRYLDKYLLSKGIVPGSTSKSSKIAASKKGEFSKWKSQHRITEDALLNAYLKSKGLNPKTASKISKIAASKTGDFDRWKRQHMRGGRVIVPNLEQVTHLQSPTLKRQRVLDRAFKKSKPIRIAGPDLHKSMHHGTTNLRNEEVDKKDTITMDIPLLIRMLELAREDMKTDAELHRVVEKLIDIRNKGVLTMDDYDFVSKLKESLQFEDTYQDTYAATQTVSPESYNQSTDDTENKSSCNRVKMIKKIYKENRISEDLYDHEKEDKSIETPRKKAKVEQLPNASVMVTGGTTSTGKPRDDIELDPVMRYRPGNTGFPPQTQKKNINK